ncbi:MAG: ABC transporter ATP-binding protein [Chloroflexi bacterium]|nr:ABC transporter ATP-binding protein [Chloroflexota bacterium]
MSATTAAIESASPPTIPTAVDPLRQLAATVAPWRGVLLLAAVLTLTGAVLELVPPLLIGKIVDEHLTPGVADGLLTLAALYLAAVAAVQATSALSTYLVSIAAQGALHRLRTGLHAHLQTLPISFYDRTPLGDLISRCTADVETLDTVFSSGAIRLVADMSRLVTVSIAMLALSPQLTAISALVAPILVFVTRQLQIRIRAAERANREAVGLLNTHLQESLVGVEVVRAFGREATFVQRFRHALRDVLEAFDRTVSYSALYPPTMSILAASVVALLLWFGTSGTTGASSWGISLGTLTAFVLLFDRFFKPITALGDEWQTVQSAISGAERICQVLAVPSDERARPEPFAASQPASAIVPYTGTREPTPARTSMAPHEYPAPPENATPGEPGTSQRATPPRPSLARPAGSQHRPAANGAAHADPGLVVEVRHLTFGYEAGRSILHDVSFSVEREQHVAVVGRTGAGKSSVLSLLGGLYAPWTGTVLVAGRNPRGLDDAERRHVLGVVPQAVHLFAGTVFENVTLFDPHADRAAVEQALRIAGADDFVRALPNGADTLLAGAGRGDGVQLSAGQRQLLALARAIAFSPAVLLLDEATAAVDGASDAAFRAALRTVTVERACGVLTVAHRLSTAREADVVVVLEAGRVVEVGPPAELERQGGRFAALAELEAAGWAWDNLPVDGSPSVVSGLPRQRSDEVGR